MRQLNVKLALHTIKHVNKMIEPIYLCTIIYGLFKALEISWTGSRNIIFINICCDVVKFTRHIKDSRTARTYASCPVCYMSDARTAAPEDSSVGDEAQPAFEST